MEGADNANICAGEEREGSGQGCGSQQGEPPEEDPASSLVLNTSPPHRQHSSMLAPANYFFCYVYDLL